MYYLNNKQETFCQSFVACHSATEAAIIAGYAENSAANQGYRLLQRHDIKKRILDIDTDSKYYNNNDIDKSSDIRRYCFIYFIAGVDSDGLELSTPVKIGITNNLKQRLRSLQTSSWVPLSVIHSSTFSNSQIDFIENNKYGKDVDKRYQKKSYYVEHLQLCKSCLKTFIKYNII